MGMKKGQKQYGKIFTERIKELKAKGMTHRQAAEELGVEKIVVKKAIERENKRQRKMEYGIFPRPQGRPRKNAMTSEQIKDRRIKELEMQVELLKKFHEELRR